MARQVKKTQTTTLDSLMSDLDEVQGYGSTKKSSTSLNITTIAPSESQSTRLHVFSEVSRHPENSSIWNPFIKVDNLDLPKSAPIPVLPTNPRVEVLRRRAYEKFKKNTYELLERLQKKISMKLQIPSLLEKWHMDCKHEELEHFMKQIERTDVNLENTNCLQIESTAKIYQLMIQQQRGSHQYGVRWRDPILLSRYASSSFPNALTLEIQRCINDMIKKKQDKKELVNFMGSPKYKGIMKEAKRGMDRLICDAIDFFEQELVKSLRVASSTQKRPKIHRDVEKKQITISQYGLKYYIHLHFYDKMKTLYSRSGMPVLFEDALFCLLCRYDMIQGAGLQGEAFNQ